MGRMFGTVEATVGGDVVTVKMGRGDLPGIGERVQILSGMLAARGVMASDDHNALVDARESVCAAIRAQVTKPNTYSRQQRMISVLKDIDALFEKPREEVP